jgi:hypothetical protein
MAMMANQIRYVGKLKHERKATDAISDSNQTLAIGKSQLFIRPITGAFAARVMKVAVGGVERKHNSDPPLPDFFTPTDTAIIKEWK